MKINKELENALKEISNEYEKITKKFEDKIQRSANSNLKAIPSKISILTSMISQLNATIQKQSKLFDEFSSKVEGLEESMLYVLHNIKKNQFLYAHYPEEWVKDYLSIKKGIKYENEFMDKKIG